MSLMVYFSATRKLDVLCIANPSAIAGFGAPSFLKSSVKASGGTFGPLKQQKHQQTQGVLGPFLVKFRAFTAVSTSSHAPR